MCVFHFGYHLEVIACILFHFVKIINYVFHFRIETKTKTMRIVNSVHRGFFSLCVIHRFRFVCVWCFVCDKMVKWILTIKFSNFNIEFKIKQKKKSNVGDINFFSSVAYLLWLSQRGTHTCTLLDFVHQYFNGSMRCGRLNWILTIDHIVDKWQFIHLSEIHFLTNARREMAGT